MIARCAEAQRGRSSVGLDTEGPASIVGQQYQSCAGPKQQHEGILCRVMLKRSPFQCLAILEPANSRLRSSQTKRHAIADEICTCKVKMSIQN